MNFGERLKFVREKMGITQAQLSKLSKIQLSQINKFEAGFTEPSLHNFRKLVLGLRVSADYLLDIDIKKLWEGM
jgi:transcriptional regulator with XRE-family HTH domain